MQQLHSKLYKKRMSANLWAICIFPMISPFLAIPAFIYGLSTGGQTDKFLYNIFIFTLPQVLFPIIAMIIMLLIPKIINCNVKSVISMDSPSALNVLLFTISFMGFSVVFSYISNFLINMLSEAGFEVPTIEGLIPVPESAIEVFLLFFSVAFLPAICEEIIYRGVLIGTLKVINPRVAVFLSAIVFGMIHGTIQQIPFAFLMGIYLGFAYLKFNSIIPCIIAHFVNNSFAGIFLILYDRLPEDIYATASMVTDIILVVLGIAGSLILYFRAGKTFKIKEKSLLSGPATWKLTLTSISFWVFFFFYLATTIMNTFVMTFFA